MGKRWCQGGMHRDRYRKVKRLTNKSLAIKKIREKSGTYNWGSVRPAGEGTAIDRRDEVTEENGRS